jgi:hypothetical protein
MLYQAIYVGPHDVALNYGEMVREDAKNYGDFNDKINSYLNGNNLALAFDNISIEEINIVLQKSED